jgi:hypothetical protein
VPDSNGRTNVLLERMLVSIERMGKEISKLRKETIRRLDNTNRRLDNMISFMGSHHADHERRLKSLEQRVLPRSKG